MKEISELIAGMSDEKIADAVVESVTWHKTGVLTGTIIRATAKVISETVQLSYDVSFAERLLNEEAAVRFANIVHRKQQNNETDNTGN